MTLSRRDFIALAASTPILAASAEAVAATETPLLDQTPNGLQPGKLWLHAALPGRGIVLPQLVYHCAQKLGMRVLYVSLETPHRLVKNQMGRLYAKGHPWNLPIFLCWSPMYPVSFEGIERVVGENRYNLVVIDNLMLLKDRRSGDHAYETRRKVREAKLFALRNNVTVLVGFQASYPRMLAKDVHLTLTDVRNPEVERSADYITSSWTNAFKDGESLCCNVLKNRDHDAPSVIFDAGGIVQELSRSRPRELDFTRETNELVLNPRQRQRETVSVWRDAFLKTYQKG